MKYKKLSIIAALISFPFLFGQFTYKKSAGAHPGSTGAPGDNTCAKAGCHVGTPVTYNDTTVNKLIFSQADSTYLPGQTYTITIRTQNPGVQRFGFEFQSLKDATNTDIGTIIITDAVRTHTLAHTLASGVRNSVTHSTVGTTELLPGFNEWTFDWTAPPVNEGDIVFYYATNSSNNNNVQSGDSIFLNKMRIRPSPLISINEFLDSESLTVYYNNESNQIIISYFLKLEKKVSLKVFDAVGRDVLKQKNVSKNPGLQKDELSLPDNLSKGIYYVNLTIDGKSVTKKLMIN
jgi:hypothetical protein